MPLSRTSLSTRLGVLLVLLTVFANHAAAAEFHSPTALAASDDGTTLYVADATAQQVVAIDFATGQVTKRYSLPAPPTGLVASHDGRTLYVTGGSTFGWVYLLDRATGEKIEQMPANGGPTAPVLSHDGRTLYWLNTYLDEVVAYDLEQKKITAHVATGRQPVAAVLTPDGSRLYVACLLPSGPANDSYSAASIAVVDTRTNQPLDVVRLPNGSVDVQGICVSPDGQYVYATHLVARYQLPTTHLDRGWMNTNAVSVIDATTGEYVNTVLLDDVDRGAANPWAIACTDQTLLITHAGTHEVSVVDRHALHQRLAHPDQVAGFDHSTSPVNDLSLLRGIRHRVALTGKGPRAMAIVGDRALVAEYFSGTVAVLPTHLEAKPAVSSISLGEQPAMTPTRQGELYFHDASLCFQQWQSCASCHPGNGRTDGINWDLLNDGIGNPKQTKSLLFSMQTPPAMVTGIRANAKVAVRAGIRHIQFAERPESHAEAIDAYVDSLQSVPSPWLVRNSTGEPTLSEAAQRGAQLFARASCIECHSGEYLTDGQLHDVGTGTGREAGTPFDTPTLREVWRTAPYLHDGRAATLRDLLTTHNTNDQHGETSGLSEQELCDLMEYVLSQ